MTKLTFSKSQHTVEQFSQITDQIDCNPIHQRLSRDDADFTKSKGIIQTMLIGMDIGQITLHETPNGEFNYESIDGGHRKRAIRDFLSNLFPVTIQTEDGEVKSVLFKDFTKEQRDEFRSIELTFCVYENLSGPQVGNIFRTLNTITKIEHQELLNSYGDIAIANAIRETVRVIPSIGNTYHQLFEIVTKRTAKTYPYWNKFDNAGLAQDEWVARAFYRYYTGGGVGEADAHQLTEMYDDSDLSATKVTDITKKVNALLKFVQRMAIQSVEVFGKGLTVTEANVFVRLYLHIEAKHGSVTIKDDEVFFKEVITAHLSLSDSKTKDPVLLDPVEQFDKGRPAWSFYKAMMNRYKGHEPIVFALGMLLDKIQLEDLIVIKDAKRLFSVEDKKRALATQGFKCAITGKPLKMKDAQGDHIVPHSKGGKTDADNLAMIATEHNLAKSDKTMEEYSELLED
jgi:hypothetical protein